VLKNGVFAIEEEEENSVYIGEILNEKKHGKGIYKIKNGDTYLGEWQDD
jgi:hypothetical protein